MKRFSWGKQGMCADSHGMWTTCDELTEATALLEAARHHVPSVAWTERCDAFLSSAPGRSGK